MTDDPIYAYSNRTDMRNSPLHCADRHCMFRWQMDLGVLCAGCGWDLGQHSAVHPHIGPRCSRFVPKRKPTLPLRHDTIPSAINRLGRALRRL